MKEADMLRYASLIALSVAAAHPAFAAPVKAYGEDDGERFEYMTELRSNGVIHITGVLFGSGKRFILDVRPNGRVAGSFGDTPVRYHVSKRLRDSVAAQLGEGQAVAETASAK
jgi:hypothetical protein